MNSFKRSESSIEISFEDILKLDKITIKVGPEKKGLILKHVEYEVRSQVS